MSDKVTRIGLLAVAAVIVLTMGGCSMMGTTMTERIEQFIDDVNSGSASAVRSNLSDTASDYATSNTWDFWDTYFSTSSSYSVSGISEGGSSATATVSGGTWGSGTTFTFYFEEVPGFLGSDYLISRITAGSSTIFQ